MNRVLWTIVCLLAIAGAVLAGSEMHGYVDLLFQRLGREPRLPKISIEQSGDCNYIFDQFSGKQLAIVCRADLAAWRIETLRLRSQLLSTEEENRKYLARLREIPLLQNTLSGLRTQLDTCTEDAEKNAAQAAKLNEDVSHTEAERRRAVDALEDLRAQRIAVPIFKRPRRWCTDNAVKCFAQRGVSCTASKGGALECTIALSNIQAWSEALAACDR